MGNCFVYDTLSVYGMELIKKTTYQKEITQEVDLTIPNIYSEIPNTITGSDNVMDYIGLDIQTYYRYEPQYIQIGRQYLNFKSIILPTGQLSDLDNIDNIDDNSLTTLSGYDESVSAIKNLSYLFDIGYENYKHYYCQSIIIGDLVNFVSSAGEFFDLYLYNTSFTSINQSQLYIDSLHIFNLNKSKFQYDFIKNKLLIKFNSPNGDSLFPQYTNNILVSANTTKYNFNNKLRYSDIYGYWRLDTLPSSSQIEFLAGVLYENGILIIATPIMIGTTTFDGPPDGFVLTNMGYLGTTSSNKYTYTWGINSSISSTMSRTELDPIKYTSATANVSISAMQMSYSKFKKYIACELKIPKNNYNYSNLNLTFDGTNKKKSVYINKLILYNEKNEVMAIAKLSKSIPKNNQKEYILNFDLEI